MRTTLGLKLLGWYRFPVCQEAQQDGFGLLRFRFAACYVHDFVKRNGLNLAPSDPHSLDLTSIGSFDIAAYGLELDGYFINLRCCDFETDIAVVWVRRVSGSHKHRTTGGPYIDAPENPSGALSVRLVEMFNQED